VRHLRRDLASAHAEVGPDHQRQLRRHDHADPFARPAAPARHRGPASSAAAGRTGRIGRLLPITHHF